MLPRTQHALELYGPGQLRLVDDKPVKDPGPYEILARVEAVGLCFSDLKLLKQFSAHPRKGRIVSGLDESVLAQISSYKPGDLPTVPGHEAACTIVATGDKVTCCKVGQRVLVQTDYRWLPTQGSNAAFGYNFEGALQQYVSMDQRVITDPATGQSMLIPVSKELAASAVALVEPWACVESSYVSPNRTGIRPGGKLLVWVQDGRGAKGLIRCIDPSGMPARIVIYCQDRKGVESVLGIHTAINFIDCLEAIRSERFDDIIYFGNDPEMITRLGDLLGHGGMINIVLCDHSIGRPVLIPVGQVHYGLTRWIGTVTDDASVAYSSIPQDGQICPGQRIAVFGAAGPMGQMHVIRLICSGLGGLQITGTDIDQSRLQSLAKKAVPLAERNNAKLELVDSTRQDPCGSFDYIAIMVPTGTTVQQAVNLSRLGTRINIFAGIPAQTKAELDLDTYIKNQCFMFGTSGSRLEDMLIVLEKLTDGTLDTNISVDAVSGLAGAIDGIKAVENRTLSGKIIVYPGLLDMPLMTIDSLCKVNPQIARELSDGLWNKAAEQLLLS